MTLHVWRMSDDTAADEGYSENRRVIDPATGTCVFELGEPWPQPPVHANLVRAIFSLEQAKDPEIPLPDKYRGNRAQQIDEIDAKIKGLREAVAAKVEQGEQKPTYAIVHAILVDDDRIQIIGRSVGRWKEMDPAKQRGASADLPYNRFAIETRWYGKTALSDFLAELLDEDDEDDEDDDDKKPKKTKPDADPAPVPKPDVCANCSAPLAGAAFCSKCGTPRSDA